MSTGLLTKSTGLLTRVQLFVRGCFNKSLFSWGVLTKRGCKDKIGSDKIRSNWIGFDRMRGSDR